MWKNKIDFHVLAVLLLQTLINNIIFPVANGLHRSVTFLCEKLFGYDKNGNQT